MAQPRWTGDSVGDVTGKRIVVTGGNSGIGLEAARLLAGKGADVVIACRNLAKGQTAVDDIRTTTAANVELLELDLADLTSVEVAAEEYVKRFDRLDVLVNNAGVMALPFRQTVDGFEMQFGTNHLGHFALTGRLLPLLLDTSGARVVTVSSNAHKAGRLNLANADGSKGYSKWPAYAMSKLANLLFTFELDRRVRAAGVGLQALAAHPGYTTTNLQTAGPSMAGSKIGEAVMHLGNAAVGQPARIGALPTVYAAVSPDAHSGDYIGPGGFMEMRGYPVKVSATRTARDPGNAAQLWEASERLTGVRYEGLTAGG